MNLQVLGIYREVEFSPGKVDADRAIMDAVLAHLGAMGARTAALEAPAFAASVMSARPNAQLVLAMCQGGGALGRLAAVEKAGAVVINSALAIRNCYRDLLGLGLSNARVPSPAGVVVRTQAPDLSALGGSSAQAIDLSRPVYVKRGDLHALAEEDVSRVQGATQLEAALRAFAERGIRQAYIQNEIEGTVVKFYGVGNGEEYFSAIAPDGFRIAEGVRRDLVKAAGRGARALGLEVWGGDAVVAAEGFSVIDLNDWPSFERVRAAAAAAIARRGLERMRRAAVGNVAI
jgi:glutathione synthase/RimK-type ligase-like ATP-grasp enzyme